MRNDILRSARWLISGGVHRLKHERDQLKEEKDQLKEEKDQLEEERDSLRHSLVEAHAEIDRLRNSLESYEIIIRKYKLPFIFINTLPKSGSLYMVNSLTKGLGIPFAAISYGYFPEDLIDAEKISTLSTQECVSQEHIPASPMNLQLLAKYCPRFVLHIRDPRQAMISWLHHLTRHYEEGGKQVSLLHEYVCPPPPESLFQLPLEKQIDWYIENYLPAEVLWINQWLNVIDEDKRFSILLTKYEDFCSNNEEQIRRLIQWNNIPECRYRCPAIEKNMASHFRRGSIDEWKTVLTPAQKQAANAKLEGKILRHYSV